MTNVNETATDEMDSELQAADGPRVSRSILPDSAPWGVLGALVSFGLLGGMGVIPLPLPGGLAAPNARRTSSEATEGARNAVEQADAPASPGGVRVFIRDAGAGSTNQATSAAPPPPPPDAKLAVAHLVITHKDSPLGSHQKITRTKEEAKRRAEEALARAKKGENFGKLVEEYSDEPGSAERHGKVGRFRHKDAIKPFADAAFALKPGEISGLVETSFGYHVVVRTE